MRALTYYYSNSDEHTGLLQEVRDLCNELEILFLDVCIDDDNLLEERFKESTPVILVGPYRLNFPFTINEVEVAAKATLHKDVLDPEMVADKDRFQMTKLEKFSYWFSNSYAWFISLVILVFTASTFLPPILAANGNNSLASIGYKFYSVLCHQLAFRSYFIEGEQYYYPRAQAKIPNVITYEELTGMPAEDIRFAREYIGDKRAGYKIALCQRDLAIYFGLGIFGIIFQLSGKKIKGLRWYAWFLIALFPIALDGVSQLPGLSTGWPNWLPIRESTPMLRTITGILFGAGTAWYVYPLMEDSIKETRFALKRKMTVAEKLKLRK